MLGRQTGRKALVVFTDGEDQAVMPRSNEVERRLQSSDVTALHDRAGQRRDAGGARSASWSGLVSPTGGRALFTDSVDELHAAFGDLLDELSNQYSARLSRPATTGTTTPGGRSGSTWTGITKCARARATA